MPWGVKSITNSSRYNDQRNKGVRYCPQRAGSVDRLGAVVLSTRRKRLGNSPCLVRLVTTCETDGLGDDPALACALSGCVLRSSERCACVILDTLFYLCFCFLQTKAGKKQQKCTISICFLNETHSGRGAPMFSEAPH